MDIREELTLGLDLGIGSCGWAVIRESADGGGIVALGVRTFDVPETDKERTPTNQLRRQHRGLRKVLRRRRRRMNELRRMFRDSGLITADGKGALKIAGLDPWRLRAEGLDRRLTGPELAVVLGHIAKHRGFKSNAKRDRGTNAPKDSSAMLKAIAATQERLAHYRTIGEMFAKEPEYARRKRNREGDYTRSILRDDQEREVRQLLNLQRRMGNPLASEDLERRFIDKAFEQKKIEDSEDKVGFCPFEPSEKRAARRSYSFELFRFLSKLASLRIQSGREERALTSGEMARVAPEFGKQKKITYKTLRTLLVLDPATRFAGVPPENEAHDFVARSGAAAEGTATLRALVRDNAGETAWLSLLAAPEKLDRIAFILSFREDIASIRIGLEEIGLEPIVLDALMKGVEEGAFGEFKGAGRISAKACRAIIPHLMRGVVYSEACAAAGYDHAWRPETDLDAIANPVARKAIGEALKQVRAIVREYGLPGRIHVELARDVGKGKEERDEISRGIEKRNKEKDWLRKQFKEDVGIEPSGAEDLLRYELWREQNGKSLYTDDPIPVHAIVASDRTVEVDHILPWSRSGDDSFVNKTLCFARENQDKKGRTPFEWFGRDEARWAAFVARVETCNGIRKGRKKRNYLLKDASVLDDKFRPRNLNDTKYATRVLLDLLARMYPAGQQGFLVPRPGEQEKQKRRVFARPGALTDRLRRGFGVQGLKKDATGKRVADDRHHALDALIVAAMSEAALQALTQAWQEAERAGSHRDFSRLEPPWPGFVAETEAKLAQVFVSRAERRRARGEAHAATIRQIAEADGAPVVFERKSIEALKPADLERVKDPERNAKLIENLRAWVAAGGPKDRPPLSPKGDPVRKVRLQGDARPGVHVLRGFTGDKPGVADRTKIVRVDVFENNAPKRRSRYQFVPVYAHQIIGKEAPSRVFTLKTDYDEWPIVSAEATFLFSLYPMCFIEVAWTERGADTATHVEGYFRGFDVNDGRITISDHRSKDSKAKELQKRLSPTTLAELKKVQVDRLGRRFEIARELRTWRGAVCT